MNIDPAEQGRIARLDADACKLKGWSAAYQAWRDGEYIGFQTRIKGRDTIYSFAEARRAIRLAHELVGGEVILALKYTRGLDRCECALYIDGQHVATGEPYSHAGAAILDVVLRHRLQIGAFRNQSE